MMLAIHTLPEYHYPVEKQLILERGMVLHHKVIRRDLVRSLMTFSFASVVNAFCSLTGYAITRHSTYDNEDYLIARLITITDRITPFLILCHRVEQDKITDGNDAFVLGLNLWKYEVYSTERTTVETFAMALELSLDIPDTYARER